MHVDKPLKRAELYAVIDRWRRSGSRRKELTEPQVLDFAAFSHGLDLFGADDMRALLAKLEAALHKEFSVLALVECRREEVARRAHILISEAGLLGFHSMAEICRILETACRSGASLKGALRKVARGRLQVLATLDTLKIES